MRDVGRVRRQSEAIRRVARRRPAAGGDRDPRAAADRLRRRAGPCQVQRVHAELSDALENFGGLDLNDTRRAAEGCGAKAVRALARGLAVSRVDPGVVGSAVRGWRCATGAARRADLSLGPRRRRSRAGAAATTGRRAVRARAAGEVAGRTAGPRAARRACRGSAHALEGDGSPLEPSHGVAVHSRSWMLGQRGHGRTWLDELVVESRTRAARCCPGGTTPGPPPWPAG